jgi:hypothetical protein
MPDALDIARKGISQEILPSAIQFESFSNFCARLKDLPRHTMDILMVYTHVMG